MYRGALKFIQTFGASRLFTCVLCKIFYRILQKIYRFDVWHASGAYPCREYKRRTVALVSSLKPGVIAEVGCGLGEIIARIPAGDRYGFDMDERVIAAARQIRGKWATFATASISDAHKIGDVIKEPAIDVLVTVNWPHNLSEKELRNAFAAINAVKPVRFLVIDTVEPHGEHVPQYSHTIDFLKTLGEVQTSIDGGDGARRLHVIRRCAPQTASMA